MAIRQWRGILKEYKEHLPVTRRTPELTLFEGNTPLVQALHIPNKIGAGQMRLFFKLEGQNPSGSFKDRGMVVAVAKAIEEGAKAIICASTGNTSASAAAYAARAGIEAIIVVPDGHVAVGKLAQALMFGATLVKVEGGFDEALVVVRQLAEEYQATLVNSVNPYRLEGQKTASFEIYEQLGKNFPDFHFIPVGNAGNIAAYWKGYKEYALGKSNLFIFDWMGSFAYTIPTDLRNGLPRMMGYQAAGAAPIVDGHVIEHPETVATAIRIGNPARWQDALRVVKESSGLIDKVTDEEILKAYKVLAEEEGIFCEPASAAAFAGFLKARSQGLIPDYSTVVCTLTGNGLKDPTTALSVVKEPLVVPADPARIAKLIGLEHR